MSSPRHLATGSTARKMVVCFIAAYFYSFSTSMELNISMTKRQNKYTPIISEVEWIRDEAWFYQQAEKGCCPFAKVIYEPRYTKIDYRCCTSKIREGKIDPLRAVGGLDYSQVAMYNKNTTILIQGDSLAEQYFLGMICFAWSSHDLMVDLHRLSEQKDQHEGTVWKADIIISNNVLVTIQFLRWNTPAMASDVAYNLLAPPDFVVLGGWHHGGTDSKTIRKFLHQIQSRQFSTNHHQAQHRVVVVDAMPSHFPGGKYLASGHYPITYDNDLCEGTNFKGAPDINDKLPIIRNGSNITLLNVSRLYYGRGNSHIGHIPDGVFGPERRDCLHWCLAPGMFDALTRMMLATIYNNI